MIRVNIMKHENSEEIVSEVIGFELSIFIQQTGHVCFNIINIQVNKHLLQCGKFLHYLQIENSARREFYSPCLVTTHPPGAGLYFSLNSADKGHSLA